MEKTKKKKNNRRGEVGTESVGSLQSRCKPLVPVELEKDGKRKTKTERVRPCEQ